MDGWICVEEMGAGLQKKVNLIDDTPCMLFHLFADVRGYAVY